MPVLSKLFRKSEEKLNWPITFTEQNRDKEDREEDDDDKPYSRVFYLSENVPAKKPNGFKQYSFACSENPDFLEDFIENLAKEFQFAPPPTLKQKRGLALTITALLEALAGTIVYNISPDSTFKHYLFKNHQGFFAAATKYNSELISLANPEKNNIHFDTKNNTGIFISVGNDEFLPLKGLGVATVLNYLLRNFEESSTRNLAVIKKQNYWQLITFDFECCFQEKLSYFETDELDDRIKELRDMECDDWRKAIILYLYDDRNVYLENTSPPENLYTYIQPENLDPYTQEVTETINLLKAKKEQIIMQLVEKYLNKKDSTHPLVPKPLYEKIRQSLEDGINFLVELNKGIYQEQLALLKPEKTVTEPENENKRARLA